MKTYWDYSEKERAAMTREQVETFLNAELMMKGVVKVDPPTLEDMPEIPPSDNAAYVQVEWADTQYAYSRHQLNVVFGSLDDARAFLALKPIRFRSAGNDLAYVEPLTDAKTVTVKAVSADDYAAIRSKVEAAQAIKNANREKEREYEQASKTMREVLQGVWDDWAACQATAREHQRVLDTYADYKQTAGDAVVALKFLVKTFSQLQVEEAFKWFELEVPVFADEDAEGAA